MCITLFRETLYKFFDLARKLTENSIISLARSIVKAKGGETPPLPQLLRILGFFSISFNFVVPNLFLYKLGLLLLDAHLKIFGDLILHIPDIFFRISVFRACLCRRDVVQTFDFSSYRDF